MTRKCDFLTHHSARKNLDQKDSESRQISDRYVVKIKNFNVDKRPHLIFFLHFGSSFMKKFVKCKTVGILIFLRALLP